MIAARFPIHARRSNPTRETSGGIAVWSLRRRKEPVPNLARYAQLSPEEWGIISDLRKLSEEGRGIVVKLIDEMVDREDTARLLEEGLFLSSQSFLRDEQECEQEPE
jgi:hypothetical protein